MDPEWVKYEATLAPFRKKDCDFSKFDSDPKYLAAFIAIRTMLSRKVVLLHPDYIAASKPWETGRPFEIFVDASDYGWCAVLCQRPTPHAAPMIIGMISKGFSDTQLRWSAMERELYALWQGVTGFERLIRGFKVYVYMDHKNNLYSEALLDNRRVAKKMLNWALELQHFNIVKVWIRGEANILSDAPSRAPWESELMEHLPLADLPLRELIRYMYTQPATFETLVKEVRSKRNQVKEWSPLDAEEAVPSMLSVKAKKGTPDFGRTPDFGSTKSDEGVQSALECIRREFCPIVISHNTRVGIPAHPKGIERVFRAVALEVSEELGPGECLQGYGPDFPAWPVFCPESVLVGTDEELAAPAAGRRQGVETEPIPESSKDIPHAMEHLKDAKGNFFVVRWATAVKFSNGERKNSLWFSVGRYGSELGARQAAWRYFSARYRGLYTLPEELIQQGLAGARVLRGPLSNPDDENRCYRGDRDHKFTCWSSFGKPFDKKFKVASWQPMSDTLDTAEEFCGHTEFRGKDDLGNEVYECLGHDLSAQLAAGPAGVFGPRG